MKNKGIWLDKEKAFIVTLENNKEDFVVIESNIEDYNVKANKSLGGAQEVAKDVKYLEREKHQFKKYFKEIVSEIGEIDALVIFGPAETYKKFEKELKAHYADVNSKVKSVQKADSMTNNQMVALIKDAYKSKS